MLSCVKRFEYNDSTIDVNVNQNAK